MKEEYETFEKNAIKKTRFFEAGLEEMEYRLTESSEALQKFEKDVVNGADPVTKKIPVEKFIR